MEELVKAFIKLYAVVPLSFWMEAAKQFGSLFGAALAVLLNPPPTLRGQIVWFGLGYGISNYGAQLHDAWNIPAWRFFFGLFNTGAYYTIIAVLSWMKKNPAILFEKAIAYLPNTNKVLDFFTNRKTDDTNTTG